MTDEEWRRERLAKLRIEQALRAIDGQRWLGPERCAARRAELMFTDEVGHVHIGYRWARLVPADLLADGDQVRAGWAARKTEYV